VTASVHAVEALRLSPTAALFEGGDEVPVSVFITRYPRGRGPDLHVHPYPEVFVVEAGTARFTVGDESVVVESGHVVVVPAETPHGFTCEHDEELRVVSVHPSPEVRQTDL
jgi:mannose-6-phosphate isomerase-like protein (cupin superfamily)